MIIKKLFIIILMFNLLNYLLCNMTFKVIDWEEKEELLQKEEYKFLKNIDCNLASVYVANDGSLMITPLFPFGKSIITYDKDELEEWIQTCNFPTGENNNVFFESNQQKINNILGSKDVLINDLLIYVYGHEDIVINSDKIDEIYTILKKKRKFKHYKLNFIVLIGEYFKTTNDKVSWGKVIDKQLLNPIISIVLLNEQKEFYELEYYVDGKWGYKGMNSIKSSFHTSWRRGNEILEVVGLE